MGAPGEGQPRELASQAGEGLLRSSASRKHLVLLARLPARLSRALTADGFVPDVFL